jgi:hypothetical protein
VAEALLEARWRADTSAAATWLIVQNRQRMTTVARKHLPTWIRSARRSLAGVIAFHEEFGVYDESLRAYEAALAALERDPLLAPDNSGRVRAAIAGAIVAYVGARPAAKPKGGRPPKFSLRPTRQKLTALGIRGELQDELLDAVHLLKRENPGEK